ncbi:hypothetical protein BHK98_07730 [Hornefia porci]|uniref:Uncharacterized protein n=1 Tax=Hornefia porci TaxID=2652292 RepID=A0A1Q9JIC0_9FIRM|nr:hypothetical protein [Hornefia porci]OLR55956.1 hypothetical protein BHK98_07730 [Hornefia porci]
MKKICLIMLNIRTAQDYRKDLYSIFGNSVTIDILSFDDYSKEKVSDVDLFLLHNNYLLKEVDFPLELPMGVPVVDIRLDFDYRSLKTLKEFPRGPGPSMPARRRGSPTRDCPGFCRSAWTILSGYPFYLPAPGTAMQTFC